MSQETYFQELRTHLKHMPQNELEEAIRFYREYAEEGGLTQYQELVARFGVPKALAAQIYMESASKALSSHQQPVKGMGKAGWLCLLALLTVPITMPWCIGGVALLASLGIVALVLLTVGVTLMIALGSLGVGLFFTSFSHLFSGSLTLWLKSMGAACVLIPMTGGMAALLWMILKGSVVLVHRIGQKLLSKGS